MEEITLTTASKVELVDVTSQVEEVVVKSNIAEGICLVFVPHGTAALWVNENELRLKEDVLGLIKSLIPERDYKHNLIDDNATAHLGSSLLGQSITFPIKNNQLVRGTWQNIFLVELDGPRNQRKVVVEVIGR